MPRKRQQGKGFEDDVAAAPPIAVGESITDYMTRTGIKNPGIVFRKITERSDRAPSKADLDRVAASQADQAEFAKENADTPENNARAKAVGKTFKQNIGNEIAYRVAAEAKKRVDDASEPISQILGATPVGSEAFDAAKLGLDVLYNNLGIPDDLSNDAANKRIVDATLAARHANYGSGMLNDDDYHQLDLLFQYPRADLLPSDIVNKQSNVRDMEEDTEYQFEGLPLPSSHSDSLSQSIKDRLDSLYRTRLSNPLVKIALNTEPGLRQRSFEFANKLFPPPIPSKMIPQWEGQGTKKHKSLFRSIMKMK